MKIKGMSEFRAHLPDYGGRRLGLILLLAMSAFSGGLLLLLVVDWWTVLMGWGGVPVLWSIIVGMTAFGLVNLVWRNRRKWLEQYGDRGYQHGLLYGMIGIPMVIALVVHVYLPVGWLAPPPVEGSLTWMLSTPLTTLIGIGGSVEEFLRTLLAGSLVVWGLVVLNRAFLTFGIDYMAVVYLYYPEESEVQNHAIYSVLRHPTYHALYILGLGGVVWEFTGYAILFFAVFAVGMFIHFRFVEEKELVERLGPAYEQYQQQVPAVIVRPRDFWKYIQFLINS
jgi:protein-S-isoprenylcysteine O-methyltransferase Ste14